MKRYARCVLLIAAVSIAAAAPSHGWAEETATVAQAKKLFDEAQRLYNLGRYEEALKSYEAAYLIAERPRLLFNVGHCHRMLKRQEEAIRAYKRYLGTVGTTPDAATTPAERADADALIESEQKAAEAEKRAVEKVPTERKPIDGPQAVAGPAVATAPPATDKVASNASGSRRWLWQTVGGAGGGLVLGGPAVRVAYSIPNDASKSGRVEVPFGGK